MRCVEPQFGHGERAPDDSFSRPSNDCPHLLQVVEWFISVVFGFLLDNVPHNFAGTSAGHIDGSRTTGRRRRPRVSQRFAARAAVPVHPLVRVAPFLPFKSFFEVVISVGKIVHILNNGENESLQIIRFLTRDGDVCGVCCDVSEGVQLLAPIQ